MFSPNSKDELPGHEPRRIRAKTSSSVEPDSGSASNSARRRSSSSLCHCVSGSALRDRRNAVPDGLHEAHPLLHRKGENFSHQFLIHMHRLSLSDMCALTCNGSTNFYPFRCQVDEAPSNNVIPFPDQYATPRNVIGQSSLVWATADEDTLRSLFTPLEREAARQRRQWALPNPVLWRELQD